MRFVKVISIGLWALTVFPAATWADEWSPIPCGESKIHFSDGDICQFRTVSDRSRDGTRIIEMDHTRVRGENDVALYDITYRAPTYSKSHIALRNSEDRVRLIRDYDGVIRGATDVSDFTVSGDDLSVRFSKESFKCIGLHRNGEADARGGYFSYNWIAVGYVCLKNHPDAMTDAEVNGLLATIKTSN